MRRGRRRCRWLFLWGDTIQATQFNDDALGRTLENLADHGPQLLATIGLQMQVVHPTLTNLLHSDTTAYALMGDYPSSESGPSAQIGDMRNVGPNAVFVPLLEPLYIAIESRRHLPS